MFSMSRNILAISEFTSGGRHIGFQDGRHIFTLLCTSFPVALWKENKDFLYLGKWLLCGNCHHMAAISKFKMAATLLYMPFSKRDRCRLHWFYISPFRSGSDGSHIQFHYDGCIAGPFQCHLAYQDTCPRIIVPVAYL